MKWYKDKPKQQTNFQRITESPEKLAKFIAKAERYAEKCAEQLLDCDTCECKWCEANNKKPKLIDWLKQESE